MLVDSHCHLDLIDLEPYGNSLTPLLQAAAEQDIEHFLCVSVSLEDLPGMLRKVAPYQQVSVSVGVHPEYPDCQEPTVEQLVDLAQDARVVAIGETGLDYFHGQGDLEWQRQRFCTHIAAAKEAAKPLIVHTRDAKEDTLRLLSDEKADKVGGVLHCFTEDYDMASRAIDLGFYISLSGIVTFRNAKALQDVARRLPLDRLLVETDAPYLAPVPKRGKPNEPAYVRYVAEYLAELRGESFETIAAITTANFYRLFSAAHRQPG